MMRVGLVCCGHISKKHIETIAGLPSLQITAVGDIQEEAMDGKIKSYNALTQSDAIITKYKKYLV